MADLDSDDETKLVFEGVRPSTKELLELIIEKSQHQSTSKLLDHLVFHAATNYLDAEVIRQVIDRRDPPIEDFDDPSLFTP